MANATATGMLHPGRLYRKPVYRRRKFDNDFKLLVVKNVAY
jgi:hypothetical protein